MKRTLLSILFFAGIVYAGTSTTNLGLYKPDVDEVNWGEEVNNNFDLIDSSVAVKTRQNTFSSFNTFSSSITVGARIGLCDSSLTNCQSIQAHPSNPSIQGILVSTMTLSLLRFDDRAQSVTIGNSAMGQYLGNGGNRPSVAVGASALGSDPANVTFSGNGGGHVGVGYSALGSLTYGAQNTSVGDFACAYLGTGSYNSCLGYGAGFGDGGGTELRISTDTIMIGRHTGPSQANTPLENSIAIGPFSKVNASNSFVLGTNADTSVSRVNVGIGTDTPRGTLHIVGRDGASGNLPGQYSLLVSTSGQVNDYHLAVSTMGVTIFGYGARLKSLPGGTIRTTFPQAVGEAYYCSDCATIAVCISTGPGRGAFGTTTSKTTLCS